MTPLVIVMTLMGSAVVIAVAYVAVEPEPHEAADRGSQ